LQGRLRIADFGRSLQSWSKRHTICGTLDYLALQMVENKAHGYAVDNWTLGVLCRNVRPAFFLEEQVSKEMNLFRCRED